MFAVPAVGWWRFNWNPILSFWFAYIVTRPLGASFADGFSKPTNGGLNLGDPTVSLIAFVLFVALVAWVAVTKLDVQRGEQRAEEVHPHLYPHPHPHPHRTAASASGARARRRVALVASGARRGGRVADDELSRELDVERFELSVVEQAVEQADAHAAHLRQRLAEGRERGGDELCLGGVVESDDREIIRDA